MTKYHLYHLHFEEDDNLSNGYIGVCFDHSKRKYTHFNKPVNDVVREAFASGKKILFTILLKSTKDYCLEMEHKLRPLPNMGWNVKSGGNNSCFPTDIKQLMSKKKIGNTNVGKGEDHHFYGKTGEQSVRFGTKGILHHSYIGEWVTPFGSFGSGALAGEALGICKATVFYRCLTSPNFKDWYFKPKEENND